MEEEKENDEKTKGHILIALAAPPAAPRNERLSCRVAWRAGM